MVPPAEPFGLRPLRGKCRRAAGCEDYIARQVWKERKQDTLTFCCESFTGAGTLWYTSNQYGGREVRISRRMEVEEGRGELVLVHPDGTVTRLSGERSPYCFFPQAGETSLRLLGDEGKLELTVTVRPLDGGAGRWSDWVRE